MLSLKHIQMQGLLDHDPVTLALELLAHDGNRGEVKKSTYFKVDPRILKDKENIKTLEEAYRRHDKGIMDPRRKFAFAYERMRSKCKELQALRKPADKYKIMMQEELQSLMLELEFEEHEESIVEWESLKPNLFDLECKKPHWGSVA